MSYAAAMKAALDVPAIVFYFVLIYFFFFYFFLSFFIFDYFIHLLDLYLNVMDFSGVAPDCINS